MGWTHSCKKFALLQGQEGAISKRTWKTTYSEKFLSYDREILKSSGKLQQLDRLDRCAAVVAPLFATTRPDTLFSLLSKRFILTTRHANTMRRVSPPPPRSLSSGDATDTQKEGEKERGRAGGRDDNSCARSKRHNALAASRALL